MDCFELPSDSADWLSCANSPISNSSFCQNLDENFDIEILDSQNTQIQQFQGSAQGTTIENIEPRTYNINEIVYPATASIDRLMEYGLISIL